MSTKKFRQIKPSDAIIQANNKTAYGYIRVSDVSQIERNSLMTQTKAIMKYCEEKA